MVGNTPAKNHDLVTLNGNTNKTDLKEKSVTLSSNNKVTTKSQQSNTLNRIKNKNIYINKDKSLLIVTKKSQGNEALNDLISFAKSFNFPYQGTVKSNRFSASNLLKKFGLESSKKLVRGAIGCYGVEFAPSISDFTQLYRKVGDLVAYYKKQNNQGAVKGIRSIDDEE